MRKPLAALLLVVLPLAGLAAGAEAGRYAGLPGGQFKSALRYEDAKDGVRYTTVFAGARKNDLNPHEPISDAERREICSGDLDVGRPALRRVHDAALGRLLKQLDQTLSAAGAEVQRAG